jgi:hypothetical protein
MPWTVPESPARSELRSDAQSQREIAGPHRLVSPHEATNALHSRGFGRLLWLRAEKRIFKSGRPRGHPGNCRSRKYHPDRITEHDPTTAGPESLGAKPNQPRRLGRDVAGAQVDVGPHLGRWVVGTQPLE